MAGAALLAGAAVVAGVIYALTRGDDKPPPPPPTDTKPPGWTEQWVSRSDGGWVDLMGRIWLYDGTMWAIFTPPIIGNPPGPPPDTSGGTPNWFSDPPVIT